MRRKDKTFKFDTTVEHNRLGTLDISCQGTVSRETGDVTFEELFITDEDDLEYATNIIGGIDWLETMAANQAEEPYTGDPE
jgi:hypothetical protein